MIIDMKIETKYNIYDKVWYIHEREVVQGTIYKVYASCCIEDEYGNMYENICYDVCGVRYTQHERIEEQFLFRTKEELINSLSL